MLNSIALGALLALWAAPTRPQAESGASTLELLPGDSLEDSLHDTFTIDDGLPSGWVHDLLVDRAGYLWVATHEGIARFDGSRFTGFNRRDTPELAGNDTRALLEDRSGAIWIGSTMGVARYRPGCPGVFETVPSLEGCEGTVIHESSTGEVWVGGRFGVWRSRDYGPFQRLEGAPTEVQALCDDTDGSLLIGSKHGLFRWTVEGVSRLAAEQLPPRTRKTDIYHRSEVRCLERVDETLWVGTSDGLLVRRDGGFSFVDEELPRWPVQEILSARDGSLYVSIGDRVARKRGERFEQRVAPEIPIALAEDREGGLWVGYASARGMQRYRNPEAHVGFADHLVFCMSEDQGGTVWLGTERGLVRTDPRAPATFGHRAGMPADQVRAVAPVRGRDAFWVGSSGGLAVFENETISQVIDPPELVGMPIRVLHEHSDGSLWIARWGRGTHFLRDRELHRIEEVDDGFTYWIHEDPDGVVWIGNEIGLFRVDGDQVERVECPGVSLRRVESCWESPEGDLWFGFPGGLVRYSSGHWHHWSVRDGLAAEHIERLNVDAAGNMWMGGRHGYFYVSLEELEQQAAGLRASVTSHEVDGDQGMASLSGGHGFPNTLLASDGTLWLAARHGVLRVPETGPRRLDHAPQLTIERVLLDGEPIPVRESLVMSSGRSRLAVEFATPFFGSIEDLEVRYRLAGYEEEWTDAGIARVSSYTGLPPGDYELEVTARNSYGAEDPVRVALPIVVRPRWWQVVWLRLGLLAGALGGVFAFARGRVRAVHRRNLELEREIAGRKRAEAASREHWDQLARVSRAVSMGEITTSIAHEVKQPLFAIASNAQAAQRLLSQPTPDMAEVREALGDIASESTRASEIIDHIRSLVSKEHHAGEPLDLSEVTRAAVELLGPEMRRRALSIRAELPDELPRVLGDAVEFQQVVINLLLNAAQAMDGARADRDIAVRAYAEDGSVYLSVEDRGVGLDVGQIAHLFEPFFTTKAKGTGMGLAMNRTIVQRYGGRIWGENREDGGAVFTFCLPVHDGGAP